MFGTAFRSSRVVRLSLVLWLGLSELAISTHAQIGNASLGGTVADQSGGVLAGADLTLTSQATKSQAK
jgi:hypothetical protein